MVVVSLPPTLQPLSALANQNTAAVQNNAANTGFTNATTSVNSANLSSSLFDGLINKFKAKTSSAQQASTPVANQVSQLTQLLTGQINQTATAGATNNAGATDNLENDNNLTTNVSINALNANLAKWEDYLAGNDYSFTLKERSAGQTQPAIKVTVSDGQVSSATYANGTAVSAEVLSSLPTIEDMFTNIRQADANHERVDALYNPRRGFPEFILFGHDRQTSTDDVSYVLNNVSINA